MRSEPVKVDKPLEDISAVHKLHFELLRVLRGYVHIIEGKEVWVYLRKTPSPRRCYAAFLPNLPAYLGKKRMQEKTKRDATTRKRDRKIQTDNHLSVVLIQKVQSTRHETARWSM